ncbi:hypothetical protein V2O64_12795 [Verrucomicrobiaceae bacterium 227]
MTDAQTFYLLLAAFYLFECLSFAPSGARAFVSLGAEARRWKKRDLAFRFSGANQDIFCAPILPWSGMLAVFPRPSRNNPEVTPLTLRHLRKQAAILDSVTQPLRRLSLLVFLHYFVILPYFYLFFFGSLWVLLLIALGELLSIVTALRFYKLHRRLFPNDKGERRLETFYNAFFPWHAMRAADLIIQKRSAHWHPLALLASAPHQGANLRDLSYLWRENKYHEKTSDLNALLEQANIDPTSWDEPPLHEPGQSYCPLCHTTYEPGTRQCADCRDVTLRSTSSQART